MKSRGWCIIRGKITKFCSSCILQLCSNNNISAIKILQLITRNGREAVGQPPGYSVSRVQRHVALSIASVQHVTRVTCNWIARIWHRVRVESQLTCRHGDGCRLVHSMSQLISITAIVTAGKMKRVKLPTWPSQFTQIISLPAGL